MLMSIMRKFVTAVAWLAVVLVAVFDLTLVIGLFIPREHTATRTLAIQQPTRVIWQTVTDFAHQPAWNPQIKSVERLPDHNGLPLWRETYTVGQHLTLETLESVPPVYLVRRITDEGAPFSGTWEFEITTSGGGSAVKITERSRIRNPFYRFMAKFFIGYNSGIDMYLKALAAKFGEPVRIS
jgi:Polyketide cyclase / dehydrase and lipid transport